MGLTQPINKNAYQKITNNISKSSSNLANELMQAAAQKLIKQMYPGETIERKIADVKVSVDGTWQRRGHCSKIGVIFIIAIDTGDVLDFEVKRLYCQ